ncbi:MAG TPA: TlpA disulfide reductase family protein [Steroidobacteraceae bacterium]|nr:TlpA disulfide reductase family protein [Steroidobacteraceae bacterium]
MEVATSSILILLGLAAACIVVGITLLGRVSLVGWLLIVGGSSVAGGIAALQLTGRLGPAQLWFRAPSFYVATAILLALAIWWFRRPFDHPHARTLRFGIPATLLVTLALLAILQRLDGRSTPISALMPTLRAPAPELHFIETSGEARHLSEYRGKVVLVNFWATWCGPCRHEMPMLSSAQTEFRNEGLVVLYLSLEEPEVLEKFLRSNHFEGVQGRLAKADDYYRAGKIYPLSYLISRDGHVAKRWSGRPAEDWLRESIRDEL